jgi:hypothetical protein
MSFHRNSGQPKIQFFTSQNTEHTLFTLSAILVGLCVVAMLWERVILKKDAAAHLDPGQSRTKGGEKVENKKEDHLE